ncbi:MAG: insulinase family protein [Bacteroidales bacterium]|nr:insulinase family protein [Bacteroidales bacterium]
MKKLLSLLVLFALIGCTTLFAQTEKKGKEKKMDLTEKVPIDKKVKIGKLDNGLTYYIRANKKPENRVQFRLVTNAGSVLEDEDQQGLAHFCEHMAFNGTEYYKGNEMISELQKNGIEFGRGINAWTAFDETVYYVDLPSDKPDMVEMGFKILDGWASKLLFTPEEIEHERGVIIEEWRGGLGASERLQKATFPILLKGSQYALRLPIGKEEVIRNFKRDVIVRFYKDWYRPDMQAVIIVGDIDVNQMEAKVKEYFSSREAVKNPRPRPNFDIPKNKEPLIAIATDKEATGTSLAMFWKHDKAPQGTVGDYRNSLIRQLINGMLSDRFDEICEKASSPLIQAGAGYETFLGRSCDAFAVEGAPKDGKVDKAIEVLLTEMRRVDQHGFLQAELDRQKEELLSRYKKMAKEENKTQSVSFAQEYTNNFLENEVIPGIRQEYRYANEFVPEITLDEVNAMVKGWITDENFVLWLTANSKVKVPTEKAALKLYKKAMSAKTTPWVDNFKDEPLFSKDLPAVAAKVTKENKALDYTEYTCPNGIRFIVKKTDYKADEIRMSSFAKGGTSIYEDNEAYMAQTAAQLIDDAGIAQFNSSQLSKKLKGTNLSISPNIGGETQGFSGNCSPKDLETMLQLLYLYYDAPRKDQESFDKNIDALRSQIKFMGENPQFVFIKKYIETVYPDNKRLVILPTEQHINSLKLDRTYEIFKERFNDASNQTFFFVGNISDKDIELIAKYVGNLPCTGKQKGETWKDRDPKFVSGTPRATAYKGTDNQGMLMIYGETKGFVNTKKNKVIINQLSDAMEISALEIIREKMGGTYSPSVNVSYDVDGDGKGTKVSWMFYIACDPDNVENIEKAAIEILNQYINEGPSAETLGKVQEQQIINRENARQENSFWIGQIQGSYEYNEDRDDLDKYPELVKSVTAKEVQDAAAKFINLKNYAVIMLMPEDKK